VYYRVRDDRVSSPARLVALLREGDGYVYTLSPQYAIVSGRDLYPWYYSPDSQIGRDNGLIGDEDFLRVFAACQALVVWPDELAAFPQARAYVEQHFTMAYADAYWVLWVRAVDAPGG
jgi:hypothetical protein